MGSRGIGKLWKNREGEARAEPLSELLIKNARLEPRPQDALVIDRGVGLKARLLVESPFRRLS